MAQPKVSNTSQRACLSTLGGDLNPASDIPAAGYSFAMTDLTAALAGSGVSLPDDAADGHH